jgi:tetratricopeptide (TPR) repeat protein
VEDYFTLVSESTLLQNPTLEPLRRQLLEAALRYYQDFAREHEDDPGLRAELVAIHFRIAVLLHDLDSEEDWLPAFQRCVDTMEQLLPSRPDISAFGGLRNGIYRLNSSTHLRVRRPAETLRAFERARDLWGRLAREHPEEPGFRNDLALFQFVIGCLHSIAGRDAESVGPFRESVDLWRGLARAYPGLAHYRAVLSLSLSQVGYAHGQLGQVAEEERACHEAVAAARSLVADFPGVPAWRDFATANSAMGIAEMLEDLGKDREAEGLYRMAMTGQESLMREYPAVGRYQAGVLAARRCLGEVLWDTGRRAEAQEEFRRLLDLAGRSDPDVLEAQFELAWFLATAPDPGLRDGRRAVTVAQRLVEREPHNVDYRKALGAAYYAAGDWRAAIPALEEAARDSDARSRAFTWLCTAAACWQLGERDAARRSYDRAVESLRKYPASCLFFRRIRSEVEAVMGISRDRTTGGSAASSRPASGR